jgi:hypothetical protein
VAVLARNNAFRVLFYHFCSETTLTTLILYNMALSTLNPPLPAASATHDEFHERGIYPIFWPPFSPDFNPIETVWNVMKDYCEAFP